MAIWLRLEQRHHGLLYPDGYQYLLMARGIGEHLRPTTVLGAGGDPFVPSFDAATKPLFAALVAGVAETGVALRSAGGLVAAVSAGLASVAGGLLVLRLTRSATAAAVCAVALLASPTLGFWWGFAGPDGPAVALGLLAAWLAAGHQGAAAGVAGGLATATRPEIGVLVVACSIAAAAAPSMRASAARAGAASVATVILVYAILRPPLEWSTQFVLAPLAGAIGGGALVLAWRLSVTRAGAIAVLATLAGGLAVLAAAGRASALSDVGRAEWPLVLAAALAGGVLWRSGGMAEAGRVCVEAQGVADAEAAGAGGAVAKVARAGGGAIRAEVGAVATADRARGGADGRGVLLVVLTIAGLLASVYSYKNPGSERYVANVLALLAVLVALGVAAASAGRRWLVVAALVALLGLDAALENTPPAPGVDPFEDVAPQLVALPPGALVSATPDAYAVLLPSRASLRLRPGARGFVVLDAGQRYYAPGFTARGRVVFRTYPFYGFVRPDGTVDRGPTTVVDGVAVRTANGRRR